MSVSLGDYLKLQIRPGQLFAGKILEGLVISVTPPGPTPPLGQPLSRPSAWHFTLQPWALLESPYEGKRYVEPAMSFSEDDVEVLDYVPTQPSLANALTLHKAAQACADLFATVPSQNIWEGDAREKLIYGKGMVAGARACAEMFRHMSGRQPNTQ